MAAQLNDDAAGFFTVVRAALPALREAQGSVVAVTTAATPRYLGRPGEFRGGAGPPTPPGARRGGGGGGARRRGGGAAGRGRPPPPPRPAAPRATGPR